MSSGSRSICRGWQPRVSRRARTGRRPGRTSGQRRREPPRAALASRTHPSGKTKAFANPALKARAGAAQVRSQRTRPSIQTATCGRPTWRAWNGSLTRADELGMVAILGYFYFGQDQRLKDEAAVQRGKDLNATNWILDCWIPERPGGSEQRVQRLLRPRHSEAASGARTDRAGPEVRLETAGDSSSPPALAGRPPEAQREHPDTPITSAVVKQSDFVLIHGNGPNDPVLIRALHCRDAQPNRDIGRCRSSSTRIRTSASPRPTNHLLASVERGLRLWGYDEQGQNNYQDGFQSPPVNWTVNTENKKQFFELVKKVTGD